MRTIILSIGLILLWWQLATSPVQAFEIEDHISVGPA